MNTPTEMPYDDNNFPVKFHIGDILALVHSIPAALAHRPRFTNSERLPPREAIVYNLTGEEQETIFARHGTEELLRHMTGKIPPFTQNDRDAARKTLLEQLPWLNDTHPPKYIDSYSPAGRINALQHWLRKEEKWRRAWHNVSPIPEYLETRLKNEPRKTGKGEPPCSLFSNVKQEAAKALNGIEHSQIAQAVMALSKLRTRTNRNGYCDISPDDINQHATPPNGPQVLVISNRLGEQQATRRLKHLLTFFKPLGVEKYIHEETVASVGNNGQPDHFGYDIIIEADKIAGIVPGQPLDREQANQKIEKFVSRAREMVEDALVFNRDDKGGRNR